MELEQPRRAVLRPRGSRTWASVAVRLLPLAAAVLVALVGSPGRGSVRAQGLPPPSANVSVFATGLDNPRGLKFGPDGSLYVAEGGRGGSASTAGQCEQVVPPIGPYTGSPTGARISRISATGQRTTVADNLPSSQTSAESGGEVSGMADVEFIGTTLYAIVTGAGCSHGVAQMPNGIIRVNPDGTWTAVADLSAFYMANPVANPEEDDFEPDGTAYSMVQMGGRLYVAEPNHGELDEVTPGGGIRRVIDISASQGHVVPTSVVLGPDGNFYVGTLNTFPPQEGVSRIYRITPTGQISIAARGLTAVTGVAFDRQGRMYALESLRFGAMGPAPGTGRVVRITESGGIEAVATGLTFPTAMTFGPDGQLYVSHVGFGLPPGAGQIVRINVGSAPRALPATGDGSCDDDAGGSGCE